MRNAGHYLLPLLLQLERSGGGSTVLGQELKCEPIKVELCARLGYNSTGMPNLMGHQLQGDAKAGLETFFPLIQYDCSPDLLFFLCSVHVPMCASLPPTTQARDLQFQLIGPCRPMCQRVKKLCLPVLQEFNFPWPDTLNCDKFPPANNLEHMCMDRDAASDVLPTLNPSKTVNSLQNYPDLVRRVKDFSKGKPELNKFDPYLKMLLETSVHNMKPAQGFSGSCVGVAYPMLHHYVNRTDLCIPKCGADILFSKEDKHFAEIWLAVWSVLCYLTTSFTLLTFLMDTQRFLYPEKCIIFLNLSYNILSMGYLIRLLVGLDGVACTGIPGTPGEPSLLVRQGLAPTAACTVVFIILYFSSLAAAVWWAITTTTWTILVFANLEVKALESRSPVFHVVGWGIPAALTISALVLHQVEGDELTGICLPGQQTEGTLLHQLIVPHSIFLGSASLFLLTGVVASLVHPGEKTRKLLARIGIFSIFYTLPQICVVGSLVYEWIERPIWRTDASKHPITEVFMMRIAMWLVVGIISGSWVWSNRTIVLWRSVGKRCCGFWSKEKKPPTPDFPRVAYRAAPMESESREGVLTLEKLATLRRGQHMADLGAQPVSVAGLPYSVENNRIIL